MLNKIIYFSIKNKLIIGLGTAALLIWGSYAAMHLPIDAVPDITDNQVQIITTSPSLAAPEVERLISFPIEMEMASIPHIQKVRSFSRFGLSVVTLVFEEDIDIYWARQQVNQRLGAVVADIPKGVGMPGMAPVTTGLGEIYQYVVEAEAPYRNQYSLQDLRNIQDWIVRRQLLGTPGVADISALGGELRQYEVSVDPQKMSALGIELKDIFRSLELNNENSGGSYIEKNGAAYFIRSEGLVGSLADIEEISVKGVGASSILIKDIAQVRWGHAVRYGASSRNGEGEVVSAIVMMLKGENSSAVIKEVTNRIAEIRKTLPPGIKITPFLDRTQLVDRAIGTVTKNLIEGALIVIFVLLLILGNIRAGLIVASVIPLALMFAFGMMHLFGVSGNLMSLGAIDFGLIVDGAVIIVEASMHHLAIRQKSRRLTQSEMDAEVYVSSSKIRNAAAFGEIIILIVYIPLLALIGTEGKMFRPMAQTVSFAIVGAFLLSLTYVPVASALFLSKEIKSKRSKSDVIMDKLKDAYARVLNRLLGYKKPILVLALLLLVVSFWRFTKLGGEFIPTLDEGDLAVQATLITGSSLKSSLELTQKAERLLLENFPEVKQVVSKIGSGEIPTDPMPIEAADIMVVLKPQKEWKSAQNREALVDTMAKVLAQLPGVNFSFQQPIQMRFNELMTGVRQDVAVKIFGEDLDKLSKYAAEVGALVAKVQGAEDIYVESVTGVSQLVIRFKRDAIARYGLDVKTINEQIQMAYSGAAAGKVYEGEKSFDLVVRLDSNSRSQINSLENLPVMVASGTTLPLGVVASVDLVEGPYQIQRDDTKRRIIVAFNVRNADVETVVSNLKKLLDEKLELEPGYSLTFGGQFENLVEAKARLSVAVPLALLLIFFMLYFTFKSISQSALIFSAIPFSAVGGIWALSLRGMPFSISAGVGFIALFGVAVLNGIVLISEFNYLKKNGMLDLKNRIISGTSNRLRPVIMTAAVASLGFLPMAISSSAGAEVQKPLATVVIGGLVSATLLTLLVLPVLYWINERYIDRLSAKKSLSALIVCMAFGVAPLYSQNAPVTIKTMEAALNIGFEHNLKLKSKEWNREAAGFQVKGSLPAQRTQIEFMGGQYNSIFSSDRHFGISQELVNPWEFRNTRKFNKTAYELASLSESLERKRLQRDIQMFWNDLYFSKKKIEILEKKLTYFQQLTQALATRNKVGDVRALDAFLSQTAQENVVMDIQNERAVYGNAYKRLFLELNLSIGDSIAVEEVEMPMSRIDTVQEALIWDKLLLGELQMSDLSYKVARSKLLPDIRLGYFNQSLNGLGPNLAGGEDWYDNSNRFQGITIGMGVPLFSWSSEYQKSQSKKAMYRSKVAETEYRKAQIGLEIKRLIDLIKIDEKTLEFMVNTALPTAEKLEFQLNRSYEDGAISLMDLVRGMDQVWQIQMKWIESKKMYNTHQYEQQYLIN